MRKDVDFIPNAGVSVVLYQECDKPIGEPQECNLVQRMEIENTMPDVHEWWNKPDSTSKPEPQKIWRRKRHKKNTRK